MLRIALVFTALPALALGFAPPCTTPSSCIAVATTNGLAQAGTRGNACALRADKGGGLFGGIFGGGDEKKEEPKKDDLEEAIDDWKEIGFDIEEVIAAEEKAKKEKK
mmetsp:Transcript_38625/g.91195  ORF Transcript_38625/g.91195 Transcript_38625/m.91195 type:complete len:107 (-) Transcript_38625:87-407(-)|eukprot:CAMPEP_0177721552 /NCGR_PEP_ID=MMETSP0484_2-20121128/17210_1 /TAXON_ID=354590 /ORGANISM="Rhodomonas lens, Strain RHODO" /LENGTH=106 /DNA_ID=CAMNT_0019233869 /DNA_START=59 /DNA_END=379 /DNA_ORIENTATION=+